MEKERIAMIGDSLDFNLGRILQTMEPDLSGIEITPSGEIISVCIKEPLNAVNTTSASEPEPAK